MVVPNVDVLGFRFGVWPVMNNLIALNNRCKDFCLMLFYFVEHAGVGKIWYMQVNRSVRQMKALRRRAFGPIVAISAVDDDIATKQLTYPVDNNLKIYIRSGFSIGNAWRSSNHKQYSVDA